MYAQILRRKCHGHQENCLLLQYIVNYSFHLMGISLATCLLSKNTW